MTEAEVARIFDGLALPHEVSPVVEVSLVLGHNGAPRGYGFVELASTVQAKRAQALMDGRAVSYDGRMPTTLVVREATPSKSRQPRQLAEPLRDPPKPIAGRVLWVSNLCFSTRPGTVRAAFAVAAGVPPESVRCSIVRDAKRRSRGFGTICLPDVASASRALAAMDGALLGGRTLNVTIDRRAGPGPDVPDEQLDTPIPAADAIAPGLLARIEVELEEEEHQTRAEESEDRRQQEIARHRRYLSAVARSGSAERQASTSGGGGKRLRARRRRRRPKRAPLEPSAHRVVVHNLPYDQRASEQRRLLRERLASRPDLPRERLTNLTREQAFSGVTHRTLLKVWVGADDFGRSQGVALINAGSSADGDVAARRGPRRLRAQRAQPQGRGGAAAAHRGALAAAALQARLALPRAPHDAAQPAPPTRRGAWPAAGRPRQGVVTCCVGREYESHTNILWRRVFRRSCLHKKETHVRRTCEQEHRTEAEKKR